MANSTMNKRMTAEAEDSFVVFLIGMRVNKIWAVNKWLPTFAAMGPMLQELHKYRSHGFLGYENFLMWRGVALLQYWESFEALERYASNPDARHLSAWHKFYRSIGTDGSVGIFHETYTIPKHHYESLYVNMPLFGLAKATKAVPATGRKSSARGRMGKKPS